MTFQNIGWTLSNHWAMEDSWRARSKIRFLCATHVLLYCKAQICWNDNLMQIKAKWNAWWLEFNDGCSQRMCMASLIFNWKLVGAESRIFKKAIFWTKGATIFRTSQVLKDVYIAETNETLCHSHPWISCLRQTFSHL